MMAHDHHHQNLFFSSCCSKLLLLQLVLWLLVTTDLATAFHVNNKWKTNSPIDGSFIPTSIKMQSRRQEHVLLAAAASSSSLSAGEDEPPQQTTTSQSEQSLWSQRRRRSDGQEVVAPDGTISSLLPLQQRRRMQQTRDVVIVGGGLAALSAALYLSQIDPERHITILEREDHQKRDTKKSAVASFAAAGMLAPQSERLPKGHLLDLCMASRRMYPDFCDLVETLARESGQAGKPFLASDDGLEPWSIGYMASGGFFAPAFAGDAVATWAPPEDVGAATWLDATQARELEPNLHPDIVGGWWFPEDASVDAVRLIGSLRAACTAAGVQFLWGEDYEVTSLDLADGECRGVWLQSGLYIKGKSILIANGAWIRNLLPVPIEPHKGQSLSLRMPKDQPPILRRVLFAQDSYIVPKADGRIVVGATVEAGSFDPHITPAGMIHVLSHAIQLIPALKDLPIEDTWAGLRPTTPDKGPIIGKTPWKNLFLAGGYWRNGVLLAPKTGQLLASLMSGAPLSAQDEEFLQAFSWDRFTSREKSAALVASSRYAAAMHPIHSRKSGTGVAASVGTELGFYSTAKSAKEEREADRKSMFRGSNDSFEKAALLGKQDAAAFSMDDRDNEQTVNSLDLKRDEDDDIDDNNVQMSKFEGSADAYTVGISASSTTVTSEKDSELNEIYMKIQETKSRNGLKLDQTNDEDDTRPDPGFRIYHVDPMTGKQTKVPPYTSPGEFLTKTSNTSRSTISVELSAAYDAILKNKAQNSAQLSQYNNDDTDTTKDDRPDPGFRIFHVDSETGEEREVPPYTSPGEFLALVEKSKKKTDTALRQDSSKDDHQNGGSTQYNAQTYDGYTDIQNANKRETRQAELEAMRASRRRNRSEFLEENRIGARRMSDPD